MNTQRPAPWDAPKLVQLRLDDGATTQEELEAELAALARDLKSICLLYTSDAADE